MLKNKNLLPMFFVIPNKIIMYLILKILEFLTKAMCKVSDCN